MLLRNENPGTLFKAKENPLSNKKHWLRHTLIAQGEILVDSDTIKALREEGGSLLSPGIVDIQGNFDRGDAVLIRSAENMETIAKGICRYSSHELIHIKGQTDTAIAEAYGYSPISEVIHRDDLMLWSKK